MFWPSHFCACYFGFAFLCAQEIYCLILYPSLSGHYSILHKTLQKKHSYFQDQLNGGIVNRIAELIKILVSERAQHSVFTGTLVCVFLYLLYDVSGGLALFM